MRQKYVAHQFSRLLRLQPGLSIVEFSKVIPIVTHRQIDALGSRLLKVSEQICVLRLEGRRRYCETRSQCEHRAHSLHKPSGSGSFASAGFFFSGTSGTFVVRRRLPCQVDSAVFVPELSYSLHAQRSSEL